MRLRSADKGKGGVPVRVFDAAESSREDGPGTRVVVYFQGCNARCPWCHSPELQDKEPMLLFNANQCRLCGRCGEVCREQVHRIEGSRHYIDRGRCTGCGLCVDACPVSARGLRGGALFLPVEGLTAESLFEQLLPALEMCGNNGGITLSGGEALLQREGAKKLLELCKARNIHTAMETSGLLPLDLYREALPLVDLWLFGMRLVAGFQDERRNDAVKSALALLKENRAFVQPVLPMVPRVYDKDEVLEDVAALLSEYGLGKPLLNPWNRNYDALYKEAGIPLRMKAPSAEAVESCESKMRAYFKES